MAAPPPSDTPYQLYSGSTMTTMNRRLLLKHRPEGLVRREDFELVETPLPALNDGEILVRVLYISMDPTNRVWMRDIPQYMPPVAIGEVMRAGGIGRVVQSRSSRYPVGTLIHGMTHWQEYLVLTEEAMKHLFTPKGHKILKRHIAEIERVSSTKKG